MNDAVINIKVNSDIKRKAQKVAGEVGVSVSSLLNAYLRQLVNTQRISFSLEEPSDYLVASLADATRDIKSNRVSPAFDNAKDAINYLKKRSS